MKREQSRAGSRFAECEKSRLKAKILITLALLLTAATGAWAQSTEPTEWELTSQDGKTWTLAEMPANNIELQVEYYAESNIFLGKEALANKANISVLNGSTAVTFDDAGKSTTTVTEGNTVTAKFTGKKVLGLKVEKKAAAKTLAEATSEDIGKIAGKDGKIYATKADAEAVATGNAVAMIAYVGSATEHGTYTHGLAIALANANEGKMNWSTAKSSCEGKTAVTGAAWLLPSQSQWKTMFSANGGKEDDYTGLQTAANNAGGVGTLQQGTTFWTSTESGDNAYSVGLHSMEPKANFYSDPKTTNYYARPVLAF